MATSVSNTSITAGDDDILTAKLKLGVTYEASNNIDVFGELWGQGFDDFTIGLIQFTDVTVSGASVGVRVRIKNTLLINYRKKNRVFVLLP